MERITLARYEKSDQGVVLCQLPGNDCTPYATWRYYVPQGMQSTSWGHYFKDEKEAYEDFKERCDRLV